jgi:hypothetical protein
VAVVGTMEVSTVLFREALPAWHDTTDVGHRQSTKSDN